MVCGSFSSFTLCIGDKRRLWQDCAYAQIRMRFCCLPMRYVPKSCGLAFIILYVLSVFILAVPFYTPTQPLIRLYFKYKTILFPKLKLFQISIIKCKYKHP